MRIAAKPLDRYPWFVRLLFAKQRRTYGHVLDSGLLWGRVPPVFAGVAALFGALSRKGSPLAPDLRGLVLVRVSQINHCPFCTDLNSSTLLKHGMAPDKVAALENWRDSDLFEEPERSVLEYTEAITYTDSVVDEALWSRLRTHFDDDALVELTGLIAFQNMSSKFNAALDVAPQGFCTLPGQSSGSSIRQ